MKLARVRPRRALVVAVCVVLLVGAAEGGIRALSSRSDTGEWWDRLITAVRGGPAAPPAEAAPQQRWQGEPAPPDPVSPGNPFVPPSLRQKYPLRAEAEVPPPPANRVERADPPVPERRGYDPATSIERRDYRDANTRVFDNVDGTQTTAVSVGPQNYRTPDGVWRPINTTLIPAPGGGWQNGAGPADLGFAPWADAATLARVDLGGADLAFGLADAAPVGATVSGNTITYRNARPDTDLELSVAPGGLKETLIVRTADAPERFVFPLTLNGLTAEPVEGGAIALRGSGGEARATIPAGIMIDAAGAVSTGVDYRMTVHNGQSTLEVAPDRAWLRDPTRAFPVRVDPSVDFRGPDATMISANGTSMAGGAELYAGPYFGPMASYLKFSSLANQLHFHTIYGAQLSIVSYGAPSCSPRPVTVHAVTQDWSPGAGFPYPGPAVGPTLAQESFAYGFFNGSPVSACPVKQTLFDLGRAGRDVVQGWVDGGPNFGLSLRASVGDPLAAKAIAGASTANPPTLYVTHTPYNADYAIPSPVPNPPVLQNQAGKVKVTVTNRGAEAWAPGSYYLAYRAYNLANDALVAQLRSGSLPGTLARGASTTIDATIAPLPPGRYAVDFSMVHVGGTFFTDEQVPPARLVIEVVDIPPVLQELYPPNGYEAPTLTPQLWARAVDIDAPPAVTLRFGFRVCELVGGTRTNCVDSGDQTRQAWTVPAGRLFWSRDYQWQATVKDGSNVVTSDWVNLITAVPQPEITGHLAGSSYTMLGKDFDPQVGNYSTSALDLQVGAAGPSLSIARTYNSLDPRRDLAFGAGWTTQFDMRIVPDDDGSGNVVVGYADGQQVRYGRNPDGTYAAPAGRIATLTVTGTNYTLADRAGMSYEFTGTGRLSRIVDAGRRALVLSYDTGGKLARAAVSNSQTNTAGRSLWFTWTGSHVTSVRTDPVNGSALVWNYTYNGDRLTTACGPTNACTSYTYGTGSHYRSSVMDDAPRSYWRLGEAQGTGAASEVAVNLGQDAATFRNVTLGTAGAGGMAGDTGATFNGSTSLVALPKGALKKSRDLAFELWFRMSPTQTGGPLLGYQDADLTATPAATPTVGVPILYVGTDGKLRGQLRGGPIAPITSAATVNNNAWRHVVLSSMGSVQTLWLDAVKVGTLAADVDQSTLTFNQIGTAYATAPASWPAWGSGALRSFSGAIDEVAIYDHPLGQAAVKAHFAGGTQAADQITRVTLPSGRIASEISYYPVLDRVKEFTDNNGGTWRLGQPAVYGGDDDLRRSVSVLDPAGRPYFYEYDALANRLLRSGVPNGLGTREEDLPGYRPAAPTPAPTPSPSFTCNRPDPGDPRFCTVLPGDPGPPTFIRQPLDGMAIRTYSYDDRGFQTEVRNENGQATTFAYDDRGNVTTQTTCRTSTQCFTAYTTYPATAPNPLDPRNDRPLEKRDGRSTSATDNRYRTTYTYDPIGNLLTQTNPDGGIVRHVYTAGAEAAIGGGATPPALLASTTDARGAVTRYAYFANGDLARTTDPSGLVVNYAYDALGRKISEAEVSDTFPAGVVTTFSYDALSRMTATDEPATTDAVTGARHQARTEQTFDPDSNVLTVTVRDLIRADPAQVTRYEYDDHGRVSQQTDSEGGVTTYSYDRFGNQVGLVDANGNQYRYAYTARNALSEVRLRDWHGDPPGVPAGTMVDDFVVLDSYAFDLAGRMVRHTDSMGRRMEYGYYLDDLLESMTLKDYHNPDGTKRDYVAVRNTYDGAGNLIKEVVGNGTRTTDRTITRSGQVETITENPGGLSRRTAYTYDLNGNVTSVTQTGNASNVPWAVSAAASTVVGSEYDLSGRLSRETVGTGPDALVTTFAYDQRGLPLSSTEPRGNVTGATPAAFTTNYIHDERGQRTSVVAPPVAVEVAGGAPQTQRPATRAGYDTFGQPVEVTDEAGNVGRTTYDRLGRIVTVTGAPYTPPNSMTTITPAVTSKYDPLGNLTEATDPLGNVSRFGYDRLNRMVTQDLPATTNSERAVWTYTYTRTGDVLSVTDPTGARVETTYDDLDRRATATMVERRPTPQNLTSRYLYDDANNLLRQTAPTGAATTMAYDAVGELVRTTDPHGIVTQYGYDFAGRRVRVSDGLNRTSRTDYDPFGRVATESDLSSTGATLRSVGYGYDAAGNLVASTDAFGRITTDTYDALSRLRAQTEPVSASKTITTSNGYDSAGRRTRFTDGRGNATVYTYNTLQQPQSVIVPSTPTQPNASDRTWTATYDAAGQPVTLAAPGGVTRQRTFDAAGRLTLETGTGAAATSDRRLGYDLVGRVVSSATPAGTDAFAYDDRGDVLTASGPSGNASFDYDADGLEKRRVDRAGTTTFTYDLGRLATTVDGITGATQTLGYDGAGQVRTVDYGAGRVRTYGVDEFGRLSGDTLRNAANAVVSSMSYTYDIEDRLIRKVTTGTAGAADNSYGYDFAGRLTSWTAASGTVSYDWDDSGNRILNGTKAATFDARDRLISDGDFTYAYTPRGTMASRTSSGFSEQFSFDAFDRLVTDSGQTYSYDSLDRVARRGSTAFSYAGLSTEVVSDGTETYARDADDELLAVAEGAQKRLTVLDEHGDMVGAFDPANATLGSLAESRAYAPFGQVIASAGTTLPNLGFQGDYTDPQTGEVNMGARWYDAASATFLSRDSAVYGQGPSILANPYGYGAGDPLDYDDPDGHWPHFHCGVCRKVVHAGKRFVGGAVHVFKRGLHSIGHGFGQAWDFGKSVFRHGARLIGGGARWLWERGKSVYHAVRDTVAAGWHWVNRTARSIGHHIADAGRGVVNWSKDRAEEARRYVQEARERVTEAAHAAVRFAVQHNPLPAIAAALKPVYSTVTRVVSAIASAPAAVVAVARDVVHEVSDSVRAVYHAAVEAVGTVVESVSTAVRAVSEFAQAALPYVIAGLATAGCLAVTSGVGSVGCFAAGGALLGAMTCPPGRSIASCAVRGGVSGAVGGAVFVATAGIGSGVTAGIISGAASSGTQTATQQYLETGQLDARGIATSAVIGGAMGGLGARRGGAGESPGAACPNSFTESTRVVMADGTTRAIRDVRAGDMVLATDPVTGRTEPHRVTGTIVGRGDKVLVEIRVDGPGDADGTVVATDGHPFHTDHGWTTAEHLRPGARLSTEDGSEAVVTATREWTERTQVRNLTVDGLHTYYVLVGSTPVLVHNCGSVEPGTGFGPADEPSRIHGPWTPRDIESGAYGRAPGSLTEDPIELHHADQMPGSGIHELPESVHRGAGTSLHRNLIHQGVDGIMRQADKQLHWWYRSQEMGWARYDPSMWFNNWPD